MTAAVIPRLTPARRTPLSLPARVVTGGVLLLIVVLFSLAAAAWLANWRFLVVETESMAPSLPRDSVALVAPVAPSSISEGDVIAFRTAGGGAERVLHRVIEVQREGDTLSFRTQGDANPAPDTEPVLPRQIEGRLRVHAARLGAVADLLQPPLGIAVLGALPIAVWGGLALRDRRRQPRPLPTVDSAEAGRRTD